MSYLAFVVLGSVCGGLDQSEAITLERGPVKLEINQSPKYIERYYGQKDGCWIPIACTPSAQGPYTLIQYAEHTEHPTTVHFTELRQESHAVEVRFEAEDISLLRRIELLPEYPYLRITNSATLPDNRPVQIAKLVDTIEFVPTDPEFIWSQNHKYEENDVFPHWSFKFPALMVQKSSNFCAMMLDIDALAVADTGKIPLAFDLAFTDAGHAQLSYGVIPAQITQRHHVQHAYAPEMARSIEGGEVRWDYFLPVSATEPPNAGFRKLTDWVWARYGHARFLESADTQRGTDEKSHLKLFDDWRHEAWQVFGPQQYHMWDYEGMPIGGYSTFWVPDPNVWLDSWFNSVRTAYGEYLYGQRFNDAEAMARAESVVNLVMASNLPNGRLPSIYANINNEHVWGWDYLPHPDLPLSTHNFDMTWTGYWLLRFAQDLTPDDKRLLVKCRALGDFLLEVQLPSGCVPSYIDENLKPLPAMGDINGETGGTVLFWAELYRITHDTRYLESAKRAYDFIEREIVPTRRWFDFECFFSCSGKPVDFYDPWTRQYPSNYLCIFRSAQGAFALYEVTGEQHYLDQALWITDYALLGQQAWSPPFFRENLLGGWTANNGDYEWSDAREVYGAEMLFKAYDHTGRLDYLERAVAAMRSNFKVSPLENWAHQGFQNHPTGRPKFHWGTGSGAATVEMYANQYGDAYINYSRKHGVGVDGCTLRTFEITLDSIEAEIDSPYEWNRPARLRIEGLKPGRVYHMTVNSYRGDVTANDNGKATMAFPMEVVK